MRSFSALAVLALVATPVFAICPGFNFALQDIGGISSEFRAYDASCNQVESWHYYSRSVCGGESFTCSPPPVTITSMKLGGNWYACRADPNSGSCDGHFNNYCCRNDGRRSLDSEELAPDTEVQM